jgi:Flp pilus assembly protein protease CpaA
MSVAIDRPALNRPAPATPNVRSWIVAGMYPLSAFAVVPLLEGLFAPAGDVAGRAGTSVPWNASLFVLGATLTAATISDLIDRRIRNYLTYTACLWLFAISLLATVVGTPASAAEAGSWLGRSLVGTLDPVATLAGAAACFAVMFFVFVLAGTGGGDVKLCTVIGAALGVELGLTAVVVSHIVAGVAALTWVVVAHGPIRTFSTIGRSVGAMLLPVWIAAPAESDAQWLKFPLPMSPFFLVGTMLTLLLLR